MGQKTEVGREQRGFTNNGNILEPKNIHHLVRHVSF